MGRLRQAPPLAGLPPAHGTFPGHAAHPTERPVVLSPNDAWGAWTPAWDSLTCCLVPSSIPKPRLMAHCSGWLAPPDQSVVVVMGPNPHPQEILPVLDRQGSMSQPHPG